MSGSTKSVQDWFVAGSALGSLLVAVALLGLSIQTTALQARLVEIEESTHQPDIVPTGFLVCPLVDGTGHRLLGTFLVVNKGLQASDLDRVGVEGFDQNGKSHELFAKMFQMPDDGNVTLEDVAEEKPNFRVYIQPGQKAVGLMSFPFDDAKDLLNNYYRLVATFEPVLGKPSTMSIGNGERPIASTAEEQHAGCYGSIGPHGQYALVPG